VTGFAIALVLLSTGFHAGWNLLGKGRADTAAFFDRMLAGIAVIGFLPALAAELVWKPMTLPAAACAAASGGFCAAYYFFLMRGYGEADFSVVYPVARALPVLILGLLDGLRGRPPTLPGWAGMCLVTTGCILAPQTSLRGFTLQAYRRRALLFILATAGGTVGYTFIDKIAAEWIAPGGMVAAAVYGYLFFVVSWLGYRRLAGSRIQQQGTERNWPGITVDRIAMAGAFMNFGSYWLVLWAYQLCDKAAYVVAFRQFSIVFGVAAALVLFREPGARVRISAALLIAAGLVLIAVGG